MSISVLPAVASALDALVSSDLGEVSQHRECLYRRVEALKAMEAGRATSVHFKALGMVHGLSPDPCSLSRSDQLHYTASALEKVEARFNELYQSQTKH